MAVSTRVKNSIEIQNNIDHAEEALGELEICRNRLIKLYEFMGDFDTVIEEEHKFRKEKERVLSQIDSGRRWLIANVVKDDKSDRNSIKSRPAGGQTPGKLRPRVL